MSESTPDWLKDVQNNSWEPEIILSGLTITFLFIMSDPLYNFFAMLVQDFGMDMVGIVGYLLSMFTLNAVIVVLIFHLILRGLWVGMVGLSYVYPQGIQHENLPKYQRNQEVNDADTFIIKIERICSLLFSFIFTIILTFVIVAVCYSPIIMLEMFIEDKALIMLLMSIYILAFLLPPLYLMLYRSDHPLNKRLNNHVLNCLYYTISSNTGSRPAFILLSVFLITSLPLSISQFHHFKLFSSSSVIQSWQDSLMLEQRHYLDQGKQQLRLARAAIETLETDRSYLALHIAYYKIDKYTHSGITAGWQPQEPEQAVEHIDSWSDRGLSALFDITLNGQTVVIEDWHFVKSEQSNQISYVLHVPIDHLESGKHVLNIDRYTDDSTENSYKRIENWDSLVFYKTHR